MNSINYNDLARKGFCVVRNLLTKNDLAKLVSDFDLIKQEKFVNPNFNIFPVGKKVSIDDILETKIKPLAESIKDNTRISTNHTCTPTYFSIEHGINFGYHQDHDSWFLYGDHVNYLNIWIPVIKPSLELTNVTVVNFEKLFQDHPELKFLESYGATRAQGGTNSQIIDDNLDKVYNLDFDLDSYSETPSIDAGDALIMRGDALHKTQDTLTNRLAISIRRLNTESPVHRDHYAITSSVKRQLIEGNPTFYQRIMDQFKDKDTCKVGDLL